MANRGTLTVCMVLIAFPIFGREKKVGGEIFDQRALTEVQSYCIEKGGLGDSDRYLVDSFLKVESKPKHLLTKMPWKLVEDCETGSPDAMVTVDIVPLKSFNMGPGRTVGPPVSGTDPRDPEAPIKVRLTVKGSDQKLLYRTEALPLTNDAVPITANATADPLDQQNRGGPVSRQDALYHVFWQLKDDLLVLRRPATK